MKKLFNSGIIFSIIGLIYFFIGLFQQGNSVTDNSIFLLGVWLITSHMIIRLNQEDIKEKMEDLFARIDSLKDAFKDKRP